MSMRSKLKKKKTIIDVLVIIIYFVYIELWMGAVGITLKLVKLYCSFTERI